MRQLRGFSLIEILAVLAIVGIMALCAIPAFGTYRRRAAMNSEAAELRSILRLARSRAITSGRHAAVKFTRAGNQWIYSLYEDGDGDGIRNDDIESGLDRRWSGPLPVRAFSMATIAMLPSSVRDPDGDPLSPTASAVQFNRSTLCSFSPTGSATPGTVYVTDGTQLCAVRVTGPTGRVRMLRYDSVRRRWSS